MISPPEAAPLDHLEPAGKRLACAVIGRIGKLDFIFIFKKQLNVPFREIVRSFQDGHENDNASVITLFDAVTAPEVQQSIIPHTLAELLLKPDNTGSVGARLVKVSFQYMDDIEQRSVRIVVHSFSPFAVNGI